MRRYHWAGLVVALLVLVAILRTLQTYANTAQGFDEPCHIAAALEWLDKHTYTLDPVHPPLARVAIGLPLFLTGERFPNLPSSEPENRLYNVVGNHIIYDHGHFARTLALARSGMLPFLALEIVLVFVWTRREFGALAGMIAAFLFSTLPVVLAFAGLAYTDLPASCTQLAFFFAFVTWIERPTPQSTIWLGLAAGLALLTKFTILLFFPAVAITLIAAKVAMGNRRDVSGNIRPRASLRQWIGRVAVASIIAAVVLWAGYGFSVGHVRESMQLSPENVPSFQHFPALVRGVARDMVISDWILPAPAMLKGVATAWALNKSATMSYVLGKTKVGGWWYFFLLAVAVKTPVPFLILCLIGAAALIARPRERRWQAFAPFLCAFAVLVVTMGVSYDAGLRHVLIVFPLLAVIAGVGTASLWRLPRNSRFAAAGKALVAMLVLWQAFASFGAQSDYIAYFNPLAGADPGKVLVTGCDLDCGQDLYRLGAELRAQHVSHVNLALWSSAQLSSLGFPDFEVMKPFQPVAGWVAISARSLRFGDVFHRTYPLHSFDWLEHHAQKKMVGKTIRLYYIPPEDPAVGGAK